MTTSSCRHLHPFLEGGLTRNEAEAFRAHLGLCEACIRGLHDAMMADAIAVTHGATRAGASKAPRATPLAMRESRLRSARLPLSTVVAPLLAAAAIALFVRHRAADGPVQTPLVLESEPTRSTEVRLSYAAADGYRPYDVPRAAGQRRHEEVPLSSLAALEGRHDYQGLAAGLFLAGDVERAETWLERATPSVSVEADRAAVLLDRGRTVDALGALDAVLAKQGSDGPALFNRALALRNLELPLAAAEAFERVAALGEPGWGDEARRQASALRREEEQRQGRWKGAIKAGRAMALGGAVIDDAIVDDAPEAARHFLYHAVRAATSAERVRALAPLARQLDARTGRHELSDLVAHAAKDDFTRRAAWGATYGKLLSNRALVDAGTTARLLIDLAKAGENDLLFGARLLAHETKGHAAELERLAASSGDPWLRTIAAGLTADDALAHGALSEAMATLKRAIARHAGAQVDWQVAKLEAELGWMLAMDGKTTEARAVSLAGLARSRRAAPEVMQKFLLRLEDAARLEGDVSVAAAYGREGELIAPDNCATVSEIHLALADARARALDVAAVDEELAGAKRCGAPMNGTLADLTVSSLRMGGHPPGASTLLADLAEARASLPVAEQAFADVVAARRIFLDDPTLGRARANEALDEASKLPASDTVARKAAMYARLTLAIGAAAAGNAEDALAEIAGGAQSGDRVATGDCALGVAVDDDRALAVVRDGEGRFALDLATRKSGVVTPGDLVSKATADRLAGCREVRVYALPPVHGREQLLPSGLAWSYASSRPVPPSDLPPKRLILSDPVPPAELGLPRLGSWGPPAEGVTWLHGSDATPAGALAAFTNATEVEIHAHGIADSPESSAALIALSPDASGKYALSASDLLPGSLAGHPVVVLAACHAAKTAGYVYDAWSLPSAFVRAGARAVFASPREVSDAEAGPFFDAVLERIRAGASPSMALRDERAARLGGDADASRRWISDVIAFE